MKSKINKKNKSLSYMDEGGIAFYNQLSPDKYNEWLKTNPNGTYQDYVNSTLQQYGPNNPNPATKNINLGSQNYDPNYNTNLDVNTNLGTGIPTDIISNSFSGFNTDNTYSSQNNTNGTNNSGQKVQNVFNKLPQFQTNIAPIVGIADGLVNILDSQRKRKNEFELLRNQLTPVTSPNNFQGYDMPLYAKDGIHIKPENKGKFTAWAKAHGMSVKEAANHVMANKDKYSSTIVKRANFAKNFAEDGIQINSATITPNNQQGYTASDFKTLPELANVVVEGGEFISFPDGSTSPIYGDKHSDPSGGEYLNLPNDSRVYSDKLKVDKEFASGILGKKINKKLTVSDLAKKFNTDKEETIINNKNSSELAKRTASINKEIKNTRLDEIFNYQEMSKNPNRSTNAMADGGGVYDPIIIPQGYKPLIDQGYIDENGNYINAQPTAQNFYNPRYMLLQPDGTPNIAPTYNNTINPQQDFINAQLNTNPQSTIIPQNTAITEPLVNTNPILNTSPNTPQITSSSAKKPITRKNSNPLGLGEYIPELFGAAQALNDFPIVTAKYQPNYINPIQLNIQDNLNRNYSQAQQLLNPTGNPSIANARANQAAANLYDATNQIYQQKYNVDNQNRQQVSQYNNQLENQANLTNLQRMDEFWNKVTARQSNKEKDLNTIVNSAYAKSKNIQLQNRQLDLANQMFPNYQYDPNSGVQFVPMTGPNGELFHVPSNMLQANIPQTNDNIRTKVVRKQDPKTGKWIETVVNVEDKNS